MDFYQGTLPSCQTLAAIGAISLNTRGLEHIKRIVVFDGQNYQVTFPAAANTPIKVGTGELNSKQPSFEQQQSFAQRVRVGIEESFAPGQCPMPFTIPSLKPGHVTGDEIVRVLEVAYARLMKQIQPGKFSTVNDNAILSLYFQPNYHYRADAVIRDMTGWPVQTHIASGGTIPEDSGSFEQESHTRPQLIEETKHLLKRIADEREKFVAIACSVGSPNSQTFLDPGCKILPWHDHILEAINPETETVQVIDPYNSRISMILKYPDFFKYFNLISVATVP